MSKKSIRVVAAGLGLLLGAQCCQGFHLLDLDEYEENPGDSFVQARTFNLSMGGIFNGTDSSLLTIGAVIIVGIILFGKEPIPRNPTRFLIPKILLSGRPFFLLFYSCLHMSTYHFIQMSLRNLAGKRKNKLLFQGVF